MARMTVVLDESWCNSLLKDKDFNPYPYRIFISKTPKPVEIIVYDDDEDADTEGVDATENAQLRKRIHQRPDRYVELPVPDHALNHKWFREYLRSIGEEAGYFGSIGGWFEQCGSQEDRWGWDEFRRGKVRAYVEEILAKHHVTVEWN